MKSIYEELLINTLIAWLQQHAKDSGRIQAVRKPLASLYKLLGKILDAVPGK